LIDACTHQPIPTRRSSDLLFANAETSPNSGYNDDYFMYRAIDDPRFLLVYYDNDTILSSAYGAMSATTGLFSAEANNGMGLMATDRKSTRLNSSHQINSYA